MKIRAFLFAFAMVVVARAERDIVVTLASLDHAERPGEGHPHQTVVNQAGRWSILGINSGETIEWLKLEAVWRGDAIEVTLTRQRQDQREGFTDDGTGVATLLRGAEVKPVDVHGFRFALSARAADEAPNRPPVSPDPTPLPAPAAEAVTPAPAAQADRAAPVVPKPRKRLGPERSKEMHKIDGPTVVGDVQTLERQFLHTFQNHVSSTYNRLTARLQDEPSLTAQYDVRITLNTETNESLTVKIVGELSERRRLLLLEAIAQACKAVVCPTELRQKYGKVLDFSFGLATHAHPG